MADVGVERERVTEGGSDCWPGGWVALTVQSFEGQEGTKICLWPHEGCVLWRCLGKTDGSTQREL